MTIKTLHITNFYHPASGGVRTFYNALLAAANRHRRPVRLVVPAEKSSVEEVGEFGRIYSIAAPRVPVFDTRYRWMLPHTYAWPFASPLRRILAEERPDLVEVCDKFWLLYLSGVLRQGWIRGVPVPVIVGLSCERLDVNLSAYVSDSPMAHALYRWYIDDFHLAASEYIADEVRPFLPDRLKNRLYVAPMGVDFDAFRNLRYPSLFRQSLLRQVGGSDETRLLLYLGRLSTEKNLAVLPPMMARLVGQPDSDYRLLVAGEGPFAATLRRALERLTPQRSLFLGHCRREDLPALYHAADAFIHPNPREPFGIAPLEAMAAGLPLVVPASGGVLTYANSENAWLAADDPESFARAVLSVHSDPSARRNKIEWARRTAEGFSWPRVTRNYFDMYDEFHRQLLHSPTAQAVASTVPTSEEKAARAAGTS